uniref:(northern house mosquito) hypothetical protein n=1 Tax=Culex pipiens TaxID=7175 RepID=A0A8D8C954_CULPI
MALVRATSGPEVARNVATARARALYGRFARGIWDTPRRRPPGTLCPLCEEADSAERERDIVIFFSFLFVINRLGRDMRCRREIIYYYYVVPFPPPPDRPSNISNIRARENILQII